MADGLTYDTLVQTLVNGVPELRDQYEMLRREWGAETPGPHVVYGDLLNPYRLRLLASSDATGEQPAPLRRIFALLERLAQHDDPRIQEVVSTTVVERLGNDPPRLSVGRRYMGETMRRLSDETERFWDGAERSDAFGDALALAGVDRPRGGDAGSD